MYAERNEKNGYARSTNRNSSLNQPRVFTPTIGNATIQRSHPSSITSNQNLPQTILLLAQLPPPHRQASIQVCRGVFSFFSLSFLFLFSFFSLSFLFRFYFYLCSINLHEISDESKPASTPATNAPTTSPENPASASSQPQQLQGPQRIPGLDFVGYGFFANLDDPSRPSLRRQMRLFKNSFDENRNVHVAINNAPVNTWRDVEYLVVDHYSVDTSSVRGYVPAATKVFEKNEDYLKYATPSSYLSLLFLFSFVKV